MSSIYLYIIYISRPWFKGSGAEAGNGSISGTSILLCHFYRYAIVHTNHLFCEEERVQRWPSFSLSSSTGGENGCVPKGFNQKHAGCRETSGVFCCERGSGLWVQGSGVWWRLRRDPSTQVATVLAFVISHATFLAAQDDETGRCPKVVCKSQVTSHLGLLIPSYSSLVTHSRLQTCGGGIAAC